MQRRGPRITFFQIEKDTQVFARVRLTHRIPITNCVSLIQQRYFADTDVGDVFLGHGTHVCGSATGATSGPRSKSPAPDYNGEAPGAKIAFDDLSVDGNTLRTPVDLGTGLFPHAYDTGAR